jgi:antitoxin (DNA-binding transcriptional repressor) of toxin-antitoxin stability system
VINQAAFGKEKIILTRRGKAIAAIVPIEDNLIKSKNDQINVSSEKQIKQDKTRERKEKLAKAT